MSTVKRTLGPLQKASYELYQANQEEVALTNSKFVIRTRRLISKKCYLQFSKKQNIIFQAPVLPHQFKDLS